MNVLAISREFPPYVLGGTAYHLYYLYSEMREMGHDVTILAGKCEKANVVEDIEVPDRIDVRWIPFTDIRGHHIRFPLTLRKALENVDMTAYDVAIAHTELPFSLDLPVVTKKHDCKRVSRKYMLSEMPRRFRAIDTLVEPTRRWVDRRSHSYSDHLIYNSDLCRQAWNAYYSIDCPSDVIHNGVDTRTFRPREPSEEGYLLFVGNSERKGLSTILDFAPDSPYPVRLVGPSEAPVSNAEALGRVGQDHLADLYSGAVATIHPARFEAFGNVILESLACGTPVVASDRCGAAELLDESCGLVTTDLHAAARQLDRADPEACVQTARKQTWTDVAERTVDVLRDVM